MPKSKEKELNKSLAPEEISALRKLIADILIKVEGKIHENIDIGKSELNQFIVACSEEISANLVFKYLNSEPNYKQALIKLEKAINKGLLVDDLPYWSLMFLEEVAELLISDRAKRPPSWKPRITTNAERNKAINLAKQLQELIRSGVSPLAGTLRINLQNYLYKYVSEIQYQIDNSTRPYSSSRIPQSKALKSIYVFLKGMLKLSNKDSLSIIYDLNCLLIDKFDERHIRKLTKEANDNLNRSLKIIEEEKNNY